MSSSVVHKVLKWVVCAVGAMVCLVVLIPLSLYLPVVQDFAKDIAVNQVGRATGMSLDIGRVRLGWPLRVAVDGVQLTEASGDTMLTARRLEVNAALLPLLRGQIGIDHIMLDGATYGMDNIDSLMMLRVAVDHAELYRGRVAFSFDEIDIGRACVDGARVSMVMRNDTIVDSDTVSPVLRLRIRAGEIELRNVAYSMEMLPVIDSLGVWVGLARLTRGYVSLDERLVRAESLVVDSVTATYLTPSNSWIEAHSDAYSHAAADDAVTPDSLLWTVKAASLSLTAREATYAKRKAVPVQGLDMDYLQVANVKIQVDSFYNRGAAVRVPLTQLKATERCGIEIEGSGLFVMEDGEMRADSFMVATGHSRLGFSALMGVSDFGSDSSQPLRLQADGMLGMADVAMAVPAVKPVVDKMPLPHEVTMVADIAGTSGSIDVNSICLIYPGLMRLEAKGAIDSPFDPDKSAGKVTVGGSITHGNRIKPALVVAKIDPAAVLPAYLAVDGSAVFSPDAYMADVAVTADGGKVAAKGMLNLRKEAYDARMQLRDFPIDTFLPELGVGDVTASLSAHGRGFDPLSSATTLEAEVGVVTAQYHQDIYSDLRLRAAVGAGRADAVFWSGNPNADIDIDLAATLTDSICTWELSGDIHSLNLHALRLTTDTVKGSVAIKSEGALYPRLRRLDGSLTLNDIDFAMGDMPLRADQVELTAGVTDSTLNATLSSGDLKTVVSTSCGIDTLINRLARSSNVISRQIAARNVDINELQDSLPPFNLSMEMGSGNPVASLLERQAGMTLRRAALTAANDTTITVRSNLLGLSTEAISIDTLTFNAVRRGRYMVYSMLVNNRPGTLDNFAHVTLNGFLGKDMLSVMLNQSNIKNETGFKFGFRVNVGDSLATLRMVPYNPVIAYKPWTVNRDNRLDYNFYNESIEGDILLSGDNSYLRIYTEPSTLNPDGNPDLLLQLSQIRLQDWLSLSPFAPPVKGDVSANLRANWQRPALTARGEVSLDNLYYGKDRVGSFDLDVDLTNDAATGAVRADLSLMVDSVKTITVTGLVNDSTSTSPFNLDFNMIHFPLNVVNPFLPKGTATLSGMLNGRMEISGDIARPLLNGYLNFDSTAVKVTMLNTSVKFPEERIPVDSNIVRLTDFGLTACNDNPLRINGEIDLCDLANVGVNLNLDARNIMVVNSTKARQGASVYGKGYLDVDAAVTGNMRFMRVKADLGVLASTNVTYQLDWGAESSLTSMSTTDKDMVRFVSFTDSTLTVAAADSVRTSMAMMVEANLDVEEGSTINVDISSDGKNKAQIQGSGSLTFTMMPASTPRLTGRYTISNGFVRYTPPMMSEKLFNFDDGSFVSFTGDIMNPILNIHATDVVKANVTQEGQNSRMVNFDVGLSVTNTLANMNVAFTLASDDDITVANELAGMTAEQRANQAVNLLLYNVYTGPSTKASANLGGNALYAFLGSQVNTWVAKAVPGVDLSFGIDQYDRTYEGSTTTAMSYSYQVSKSLFNDRVKIIVGGSYSTDADADENFSQNLINDISFEYLLNQAGSMYVRVFRHTGYESILEGEITKTGVGFVYKRKLDNLRNIFSFGRRSRTTTTPTPNDETE